VNKAEILRGISSKKKPAVVIQIMPGFSVWTKKSTEAQKAIIFMVRISTEAQALSPLTFNTLAGEFSFSVSCHDEDDEGSFVCGGEKTFESIHCEKLCGRKVPT
jgi:hypothetical protein